MSELKQKCAICDDEIDIIEDDHVQPAAGKFVCRDCTDTIVELKEMTWK